MAFVSPDTGRYIPSHPYLLIEISISDTYISGICYRRTTDY